MNYKSIGSCLAVLATLAMTSCSDNSTSSSGSASDTLQKAAETTAKSVTDATQAAGTEAAKVADATKAGLQDTAKAVQKAVADAGPAAQQAFNDLVTEVKKLIADGKGTEAVQRIQSALSSLKLTPEQQKLIEDLKAQARAVLSKSGVSGASKTAGDVLQPKPKN
jgi:hypothetical protein